MNIAEALFNIQDMTPVFMIDQEGKQFNYSTVHSDLCHFLAMATEQAMFISRWHVIDWVHSRSVCQ